MAGTQLDIAGASAITKQKYTQDRFVSLSYPDNPLFALMPKDTDFGGDNIAVALRTSMPLGRGVSIAQAQASRTASQYDRFVVRRVLDYASAVITGDTLMATRGDENALINGLTKEVDGATHTCMRSLAIAMYHNGGGARGQISTATSFTFPGIGGATISIGVGTAIIQLANLGDVTNFERNMFVCTASDDGTGGAGLRGGGATVVQITAVDRDNGLLTASANWNTMAGTSASDFIFMTAPGGQGSDYGAMVKGLAAWIPFQPPASSDNFLGVNRSADSRYFGMRQVGSGAPIEETIVNLATKISREGGKPDHFFMNPLDWAALVNALGSKVIYDRAKTVEDPDIGFDAVKIMGPKGPLKCIADQNVRLGVAYMLQLDTWKLATLGTAPMILDGDGLVIRALSNSDAYEVRIGYYGNMYCEAPGWNGVATL